MTKKRNPMMGFTLVEMLVVVALIAIVASIGISLMSGATKDAAETVSIATQKQLTSSVQSYVSLHGGILPDQLDSLMRSDFVAAGATYTRLTGSMPGSYVDVADNPGLALYVGVDADHNGVIDDPAFASKGIYPDAWNGVFRTLTVTKLTSNDVANLASLGITAVWDITPSTNLFHGEFTYSSAKRTLAAGDPVCTVDPQTGREGIDAYHDLGFKDITDTTQYPTSAGDLTADARAKALTTQKFFVFGIGPKTPMIGDRRGGLQEPPASGIVKPGYYNRFLLVVKMPAGANDMNGVFAGILDPMGKNSRKAYQWATRTE